MRAVCLAVAAIGLCAAGVAPAQEPLPLAPASVEAPLPGGKEISRPLTPVEVPAAPPAPLPVADEPPEGVQRVESVQKQKVEAKGPLGPSWSSYEVLVWWNKAQPLPPLVTATRTGAVPVFGTPDTVLLVGGRAMSTQGVAGGRFLMGNSLTEAETVGWELVYFFLGSRTFKTTASAGGSSPLRSLGLPYVNAVTGREEAFPVAMPGVATGSVYSTTTTRLQGAEANLVANLVELPGLKLNGLVGYRFLQVHEGLTVEQLRFAGGTRGTIYDEFVAHNRFNGGQLGLHADIARGIVFCELTGKVALGQTFEMVRIDGVTAIGAATQGGVYSSPSNIGRLTRGVFAVAPEGTVKLGLKLTDSGRFYVGYNFLYLSDCVRPGDQIDRTLNAANIPALNPGGTFVSPDRPRAQFVRSDFWTQGLMVGLETRY